MYCCMIRIYRYLKEMSTVFWKILQNFANFASFAFGVVFCISAKGIAIINIIDQFFSVIQLMEKFVFLVELEEAVLIVMEPIIKVEAVLLA